MKAGIITGLDNKNYGNRLQNYAVNRILQQLGFETVNIYAYIQDEGNKSQFGKIELLKRKLPLRIRYLLQRCRTYKLYTIAGLGRAIRFMKITRKYMPVNMYYTRNYEELHKKIEEDKIDIFFVGSDQVWNPHFAGTPFFFLSFVQKEKRASFVASIGTEKIPNEKKEFYKKSLQDMAYISVREKSAKKIIEQLIGREVDCFLDPTLLLSKAEWFKVEMKPKCKLPSRYILAFFFGREYQADIERIANIMKLEVVYLNDMSYLEYYMLDPMEFLYVIHRAEIVLTDSFHVTALSIKYRKQFYVYQREAFPEMFTRMKSMLEEFNLVGQIRNIDLEFDSKEIEATKFDYAEKIMQEQYLKFRNILSDIVK